MSTRRGYRRLALGVVAFGLIFSSVAFAKILSVSLVAQEQDQWCWAATSKCVINYYGTSVSQCQIAEYTRTHATWYNFGSVNCCTDASRGCNYWNYMYGESGSIQDILSHWNLSSTSYTRQLSQSEVSSTINDNRPFILRWGWTSGGGHFLVGYGLDGNNMNYMNPWPGEGLEIASYSWVVSGSDHTWTHTVVVTTPYVVNTKTLQIAVNNTSFGTTSPVPGSYAYNTGADVQVLAIPAQYYVFTGWSGDASGTTNPKTVHMDDNKSVTASFKLVSPPTNLTAVRLKNRSVTQTEHIVDLSWNANMANAGLNIVVYRVYQKAGNDWISLTDLPTSTLTYRVRMVPMGEQTFGVAAVHEGGVESAKITVLK